MRASEPKTSSCLDLGPTSDIVGLMPHAKGPATDEIPLVYALSGPLLTLGAVVPLLPGGRSFWRWSIEIIAEHGWAPLVWILGAATPFLLGAAMTFTFAAAFRGKERLSRIGEQLIAALVCLMISHAIIFSAQLWWHGLAVATTAFFGVSLVSGLALALRHADLRASRAALGHWASLCGQSRLFARWGCVIIAAACAWGRLQIIDGHRFAWGIELMMSAAALTLWALSAPPTPNSAPQPSDPRDDEQVATGIQ